MKIRLENLTKKFQETTAVSELDVEIEDGHLVCLLGPSGCGKSTTLSMIAGLEKPTEGKIWFDDKKMNDIEAEDRDIGMVFQDYALYPHMTIRENIAFPLKMKKIKKAERIEKVDRIAELMQIQDLLKRKPGKLSGGQQQRAAIARALVKEPRLLLLDEPLSNLDARLRIELREEIRRLQKKLAITTIFVTHDQEEAMSLSDRILLMDRGKMIQYDTPKNLYKTPNSIFAAKFLGNPPINLIGAQMKKNAGGEGEVICLENGESMNGTVCTIHNTISEREDMDNITVGIRPEDMVIATQGEISGVIQSVQTLGKEVYIRFDFRGISLTACTGWDRELSEGEKIAFHPKRIHIFPNSQKNRRIEK